MSPSANKSSRGLANIGGSETSPANVDTMLDPSYALPYVIYIKTPKNTSKLSPMKTTIDLPMGRISRVWCEFPKGCSGLASFQIWRGPRQIFPLPDGAWMASDASIINFAFTHNITTEPFTVDILTSNEDDTFSHTIWVGIEMKGLQQNLPQSLIALMGELDKTK